MDTSETYIKMCEKAEEIQKTHKDNNGLHKWESGDYLWDGKMGCVSIWCYFDIVCQEGLGLELGSHHLYSFDHHQNLNAIWLPRQDQLQEMVNIRTAEDFENSGLLRGCGDMSVFVNFLPPPTKYESWSMEQLWLAFIMKEKYSKVWNGEEWVK